MSDYPEDVMQQAREAAAAYWQTVPASSWSMPQAALDGVLDTDAQVLIAARAITADRKRRVVVRGLEWRECLALGNGRALVAVGCFGNEFARIDLPADDADIAREKASASARYQRAVTATLEFTDEPDPRLAAAEADAERLAEALEATKRDFMAWARIRGGMGVYAGAVARIDAALSAHETRKGERHE